MSTALGKQMIRETRNLFRFFSLPDNIAGKIISFKRNKLKSYKIYIF